VKQGEIRTCFQAAATGDSIHWQLSEHGLKCEVMAPSLIPKKVGEADQEESSLFEQWRCPYRQAQRKVPPAWVGGRHLKEPKKKTVSIREGW